jgi:UDP:flavonoid glycosyltransferase YjiC (YdhE family)
MVPFARALLAAGHEVRWATSEDLCPTLEQAGIAPVAAGLSSAQWREPRDRRIGELAHLPPDERTDQLVAWLFGETLAPAMLRDVLAGVRAWRPDVIVHDTMEFAAPIAAHAIGVVHFAHSYGPLAPAHRMRAIAASVTSLWKAVGIDPPAYGSVYGDLYLDVYPPSLRQTVGDRLLRRQAVRPVPYAPPGDELPAVLADDGRRLVYTTFGTELPDQRPLKIVLEAIAPLNLRVLATVGPRSDPRAFGTQPENVTIVRYVPQTAVLPHASAVISHAGSGTVLAALAAGLPQLCLPQLADQPLNAAAIADAGAGLALNPDALEPATISESLTRLLSEVAFRSRACALRDEIATMPSPQAVAARLPELVDGSLRSSCSRPAAFDQPFTP